MISINCDFSDGPLMIALAHVSYTDSPNLLSKIAEIKSRFSKLNFPVAELSIESSVQFNPLANTQQKVDKSIWTFRSLDRRDAIVLSQNAVVLYQSAYQGHSEFKKIVQEICDTIGESCEGESFVSAIAFRYISSFENTNASKGFLVPSVRGVTVPALVQPFHQYLVWGDTENGSRLVASVRTVNAGQVRPQDVVQVGVVVASKFEFSSTSLATLLDIHETLQLTTLKPFSELKIQEHFDEIHSRLKTTFLDLTTSTAHDSWGITNA